MLLNQLDWEVILKQEKKALKELIDWIRKEIKEITKSPIDKITNLDKMRKFFSSPDDDGLPGDNSRERF